MRVVAVSRILNEADVIEPFLRHHAALLDLHILLDNGSTDGTIEIVRALHAEGMPLRLYQTVSPLFMEVVYNTGLYRLAVEEGADWVLFIDADELLVLRGAARPSEILALAPDGVSGLRVPAYRYAMPRPGPGQHPFEALRFRAAAIDFPKIAVRRLDPTRVTVYAGNHFAFIDGHEDLGFPQERMWLAHVPERDKVQVARKIILGRLKAAATGAAAEEHFSTHRVDDFTLLKANAATFLAREPATGGLIEEAAPYLGGPLRHTASPDEISRTLSLFAAQAEVLAKSHGALLDRKRLLRRELERQGQVVTRLI